MPLERRASIVTIVTFRRFSITNHQPVMLLKRTCHLLIDSLCHATRLKLVYSFPGRSTFLVTVVVIFVDLLDHDCSAFERPKSEGMRWRESWTHEVCIETVFKDFVLDSKFSSTSTLKKRSKMLHKI